MGCGNLATWSRMLGHPEWTLPAALFSVPKTIEGETYAYPDDITAEQAQDLWTPGPDGFTAVAIDGDEVMGAALMQPNRPGRGSHVATASFMVSPAARGHGDGPRTPGSVRCSSTPSSTPTRQRSDSGSHSGSTR